MNFIQKVFSGLAVGALLSFPVEANQQYEERHFEDHIDLVKAVHSTGVLVKVNPKECGQLDNAMGWYFAAGSELVVCQENGVAGGPMVAWTDEDLDTLRHEAHHVVQDCMDTVLDGELDSVYDDPIGLAQDVIGNRGIRAIIKGYEDATEHRQVMEFEAFSVAELDDPREQIRDIQRFCF